MKRLQSTESMYVSHMISPPNSGLPLFRVMGQVGLHGLAQAMQAIGDRRGDLSFDLEMATLGKDGLQLLDRLAERARVGGGRVYLRVTDGSIRRRIENAPRDADIELRD